ncbi:unnamed protein product, partial [marine sediment metagenome]
MTSLFEVVLDPEFRVVDLTEVEHVVKILGAIKVKSVTEVRDKWLDVTPCRASYYEKEASVAGSDWEKGAIDASGAFKAGISAANIEQLFKGGIKRAGAAKYERKVKDV